MRHVSQNRGKYLLCLAALAATVTIVSCRSSWNGRTGSRFELPQPQRLQQQVPPNRATIEESRFNWFYKLGDGLF